jgi:hypothetical protein
MAILERREATVLLTEEHLRKMSRKYAPSLREFLKLRNQFGYVTYFNGSPANAFRTSDCEIPNCRAILDGVMPALKAARTAFSFPCGKGTATDSTRPLRGLSSDIESFLPRRLSSATTAETNRSNC